MAATQSSKNARSTKSRNRARQRNLIDQLASTGTDLLIKTEQAVARALRQRRLQEIDEQVSSLELDIARLQGNIEEYQERQVLAQAHQHLADNGNASGNGNNSSAIATPPGAGGQAALMAGAGPAGGGGQFTPQYRVTTVVLPAAPFTAASSNDYELNEEEEEEQEENGLYDADEELEKDRRHSEPAVLASSVVPHSGGQSQPPEGVEWPSLPSYLELNVATFDPEPSSEGGQNGDGDVREHEQEQPAERSGPGLGQPLEWEWEPSEAQVTQHEENNVQPTLPEQIQPQPQEWDNLFELNLAGAESAAAAAVTPLLTTNPTPGLAPAAAAASVVSSLADGSGGLAGLSQITARLRGEATPPANNSGNSNNYSGTGGRGGTGGSPKRGSSGHSLTLLALAFLTAALLLAAQIGGPTPLPIAQAGTRLQLQQQEGSPPILSNSGTTSPESATMGYYLAFEVRLASERTDRFDLENYTLRLVRDGVRLAATAANPAADPVISEVQLRYLFVLKPPTSEQDKEAELQLLDSSGVIITRKALNWRQLPPGRYTVQSSFSMVVNPQQPQQPQQINTTPEKLSQGLPGWASELTVAAIDTLTTTTTTTTTTAATSTTTNTLPSSGTGMGAGNPQLAKKAEAGVAEEEETLVIIRKRNPIFPVLMTLLLLGAGGLLFLHLFQTNRPRSPYKKPAKGFSPNSSPDGPSGNNNAVAVAVAVGVSSLPTPLPARAEGSLVLDGVAVAGGNTDHDTGSGPGPGAGSPVTPLGSGSVNKFKLKKPVSSTAAGTAATTSYNLLAASPGSVATTAVFGSPPVLTSLALVEPELELGLHHNDPQSGVGSLTGTAGGGTTTTLHHNDPQSGVGSPLSTAKVIVPDDGVLASSRLGAAESVPQHKVREVIIQHGTQWLAADEVSVNLEYSLRSAARQAGLNTYFKPKLARYMDNGSAIDLFLEVSRYDKKGRLTKFVAVEVDGPHHNGAARQEKDKMKETVLTQAHIPVVRVKTNDLGALEGALRSLAPSLWPPSSGANIHPVANKENSSGGGKANAGDNNSSAHQTRHATLRYATQAAKPRAKPNSK